MLHHEKTNPLHSNIITTVKDQEQTSAHCTSTDSFVVFVPNTQIFRNITHLVRIADVSETTADYEPTKGTILDTYQIFMHQKTFQPTFRGGSKRLLQLLKRAIGRHELFGVVTPT